MFSRSENSPGPGKDASHEAGTGAGTRERGRGGRPRLPAHLRRTCSISVSVNGEELSVIEWKAGLAGMSTSVYVRQAALGANLSARFNDRVYAALGRIGGNLNQLARIANRTRFLPLGKPPANSDSLRLRIGAPGPDPTI